MSLYRDIHTLIENGACTTCRNGSGMVHDPAQQKFVPCTGCRETGFNMFALGLLRSLLLVEGGKPEIEALLRRCQRIVLACRAVDSKEGVQLLELADELEKTLGPLS